MIYLGAPRTGKARPYAMAYAMAYAIGYIGYMEYWIYVWIYWILDIGYMGYFENIQVFLEQGWSPFANFQVSDFYVYKLFLSRGGLLS